MRLFPRWSFLRKPGFWAACLVLLFMLSGVVTLGNYALSWDEGLGNLFFGERYFRYFITLNPVYLDFQNSELGIHQRPLNLFRSAFRGPHEFPPLADTVSAGFMEVLAYRLGLLDPVDAFHLPKILLSGLLLWFLYRFAAPHLGNFAALLGILMLGAYPRFWGDMHFNPKDIPITALFAFVLIAFWAWYERPSPGGALLVGLLGGMAMSIKANALFLPVVVILGIWPWQWRWPPWEKIVLHLREQWPAYLLMLAVAPGFHLLSWPYLYGDPLGRLKSYYQFIYTQGGRGGVGSWNLDPLVQTLTTMPEAVLVLLAVGLFFALSAIIKGKSSPFLRLLLVWLALPVGRASLPNAVNFDGIRHFVEFLPAACLLAGYGASQLLVLLSQNKPAWRAGWQGGLVALLLANLAIIHWHYHPYQYTYYNSMVGGLYGAHFRANFPEATDYWAISYRHGIAWLNANAEANAEVVVPIAGWNVRLVGPLWMRTDLSYLAERRTAAALAGGQIVYLMFINRKDFFTPAANYCMDKEKPAHQILVDGVPILQIYRLDGGDTDGVRAYLRNE